MRRPHKVGSRPPGDCVGDSRPEGSICGVPQLPPGGWQPTRHIVIPAQAGIQTLRVIAVPLDFDFRRNDGYSGRSYKVSSQRVGSRPPGGCVGAADQKALYAEYRSCRPAVGNLPFDSGSSGSRLMPE
ncbi:MAG: hypothetical protein FWG73_08395 [Planctomycetaceae bacterium]|nr:hypothetical protein [Planctomycetaceae bacterium]